MIIKTIELENFKSHINTRIGLDTGISIIMGDNGAGKSSILESISFALFKEYASKKMDKLINNEKNQMKVTVEFIANGRTYRVVRKRKRNSSPESMLYVEDNGHFSVIEKGDAAVSDEVEKIIDLDKNLFLNAVYVRQGEIANLITKNPAEKKEMMGRLLGVDELENSWKNMKFVIDNYKNREIRINGKLENFGNIEDDLKEKENKKDELTSKLTDKESQLEKTEVKLGKLKGIKEFFDQKELHFNKLKQEIEHGEYTLNGLIKNKNGLYKQLNEIIDKEEQIGKLKPQISKIKTLENFKDQILYLKELENEKVHIEKSLNKIDIFKHIIAQNKESHNNFLILEIEINDLNNSRKEFEGSNKLKNNFESNIKNLSIEIEELEKSNSNKLIEYEAVFEEEIGSIDQLESCLQTKKMHTKEELHENQEQINYLNSKISDLKGQNKEILKAFEELQNAEDSCPVCESNLEENRKKNLLNKYQMQIEINKSEISSSNENLIKFNLERQFLDKKSYELEKINIDILKKDLNDLEKKKIEIDQLKYQLIEIEKSLNNLRDIDSKLDEKKALKDELKDSHQKYLGAQNSLEAMEDPDELLNAFNSINNNIKPLKTEIDELSAQINIEKNQVNAKLEDLRIIKEMFDKLSGEVKYKEEILKKIDEVEDEIGAISLKIEDKQEKFYKVGYDSQKHIQAKDDLNKCQTELEEAQKEVGILKGQLKITFERISELKEQIESFNEDKKELERIGRFIGLLNEIRNLYGKDGLQKDLRNRSRPLIENNTLQFFNKFNFEYSDIKLNEDYDVTLFGPSGENTLDMISGGEIIAVAIALRLGIAKTLVKGNLELMILDEPTVHLDSYRRHELIDVIKKLSVIPQMIIVTHDTGLEEAATNILKMEKKNGISELVDM